MNEQTTAPKTPQALKAYSRKVRIIARIHDEINPARTYRDMAEGKPRSVNALGRAIVFTPGS